MVKSIVAILVILSGVAPAFAQDGVSSWWKLDEGTGTRANNSAPGGSPASATLVNGPTFSATDKAPLRYANTSSVRFDGVNDCIQMPLPPPTAISNTFTMSLWCKPTGRVPETVESNTGTVGASGLERYAIFPESPSVSVVTGTPDSWVGFSVGTNGIRVFEGGDFYLAALIVYNPPAPMTGWTHIAVVYLDKVPTLYVNGTAVRTAPNGSTKASVHPGGSIGGSTGNEYWNAFGKYAGFIDEVRVYPRALTNMEIARLGLGNESVVPSASSAKVVNVRQSATVTVNSITFSADLLDAADNAIPGMLEVEVRLSGTPFTGVATAGSVFPFPAVGRLSVPYTIPEGGPYDWRYRAGDANLNFTAWTDFDAATPDFFSDQVPPGTVVLVSPVNIDVAVTSPSGGPVIFRWAEAIDDGGGPSTYDIQILRDVEGMTVIAEDGGITGTYAAFDLATTTALGNYWRVRATDAMGNVGEWCVPAMFRVYHDDRVDHSAGDAAKVCGFSGAAASGWGILLLIALLFPALRRR